MLEISSGSESDGQSALRQVEEREAANKGGKRGPENKSLQHWKDPVPTVDVKQGLRWMFRCRYCQAYASKVVCIVYKSGG